MLKSARPIRILSLGWFAAKALITLTKFGRLIRCDACSGSPQIETVKFERAEPHVGVCVGKSGDYCLSVKIGYFRMSLFAADDFLVATDGLDASP